MNKLFHRSLAAVLSGCVLLPVTVMAHTGVGVVSGIGSGFTHPLGGLDHIIAMFAVGFWAAQLGGRALWAVPGAFVSMMLVGGILGFSGIAVPYVEAGILASVLVLGILIAGALRLPAFASGSIVGGFALFHGYAHGVELPLSVDAIQYGMGFALATVVLHLIGLVAGASLRALHFEKINRLAGGAIVLSGLYLAMA